MEENMEQEEEVQKREFHELSWKTTTILNRLKTVEIGELITYKELSLVLNVRDIRQECRWYIESARKRLQRERQVIFKIRPNIGLIRMDNKEKVDCGDTAISKIKRAAKRGINKLKCIDIEKLDNELKTKVFSRHSALGAISLFTKGKTIKNIESKVNEQPRFMEYKPDLSQFK